MSESNPNILLPSQESASEFANSSDIKLGLTSAVSESETSESAKPLDFRNAKPTGLKLPIVSTNASATRIGRLCNNISKPAIPPNSTNGTAEKGGGGGGGRRTMSTSVRRISDELARRRLADLYETDEHTIPAYGNGKWAYDRKMSSGSVLSDSSRKSDDLIKLRSSDASTSADSYSDYWKSDFEPRRASDASVVLTEDTDQFIIGDRVWVGGVKPGQIAYIGETQFAPGEWAGVVLDEPIGKNDGTVANIRYFQCEPKKGIFSRLTRLTRYPLTEGGIGELAASRSVPSETRKSNGSLLTSVPKKSSLVLTPSEGLKNSFSKPPSPDSSPHSDIQVGDRVIVKSSQGSKAGILRYLGTTDFAAGEWCGVELDDPLGKNDGSVSGTRYFECRPKFGLFAPLHKVSKSPANKRLFQGNCVIHNRSGATAPGIRRQKSKESLLSLSSTTSTAASVRSTNRKIGARTPTTPTSAKNALQETLKEKELHIEQLLKERDLERAEVTRAASQADEAERQLVALRQEFEQQKEEAEARVSDLDAMMCLLKSENEELKNLLDDERKKYEDLQFRFEEETIEKADIKSLSMKYEEKMKMLEKTLLEERKRMEALEQDSNKLFEAEEQMVFVKDELDSAREETAELKKMRSILEQKHISLEAHLTSARADIESLKIENELLKSTASKNQTSLRENLVKITQAFEECKKELEKKESELDQLSKEMAGRDQSSLEKELEAKYLKIINELTQKHHSETEGLSRQLEDLRSNSETKMTYFENESQKKTKLCSSLETQLNEVNILLSKATAEKSMEQNMREKVEEKLQKELKKSAEEILKMKEHLIEEAAKSEKFFREKQKLEEEFEEERKLLTDAQDFAKAQVSALNGTIEKQREELEKTKTEIEFKSKECDFLKEALTKGKKEEEKLLKEIDAVVLGKKLEVEKLKEELEKQKEEFDSRNKEIKQLYEGYEKSFKAEIRNLEDAKEEKRKEVETLSRNLENMKNSLTARQSQLETEQINNKNLAEKLTALEQNYRNILEEKDQLQLQAGDAVRKLQSLEDKLTQVVSQKSKLELDISNFINTSNDSSLQLAKLNEDLRAKEKELDSLREDLSRKVWDFERTEQELKQTLEKQETEMKISKKELEEVKHNHMREIEDLKSKLEASGASLHAADLEWSAKMQSLKTESSFRIKDLEEHIRLMEKREVESRNKHEEEVKKMKEALEELSAKLNEAETAATNSKSSLERKIKELDAERFHLLESVENTKTKFMQSEKEITEKIKKDREVFASETEKLRNELKETSDKLASTVEELIRAKDEKNILNEEKSKLENAVLTVQELLKKLQVKNSELEVNATSVQEENKVLKDIINQLREEKYVLDKELSEKAMHSTELHSQLEALEYFRKTKEAENEVKIRNLEDETSELRSKLQKSELSHSAIASEKMKQIDDLKDEIDKLKQRSSQVISGKEKDIEEIKSVLKQLNKELEDEKFESERKSEQILKMEKQFQQIKNELESEKKKREEYGRRLNASESEKIDLKEKFEEQSKLYAESVEFGGKLAEAKQKLEETERREQETANNAKLEKETLEKMLETTNNLLSQRENEAKAMAKEVEALKQEKIHLMSKSETSIEKLEMEKAELQKLLDETKKTEKMEANPSLGDANQRELQEERDFQKGQVDFLNSVIVDMQKKNDALKARIEILEMGFAPEDVDDFNLHNITTRIVAPRLFCDICDRFDLHDTEDCPTQANEDVPPMKSSKVRIPPPERPYCEICEVFGHDAANCNDGETF